MARLVIAVAVDGSLLGGGAVDAAVIPNLLLRMLQPRLVYAIDAVLELSVLPLLLFRRSDSYDDGVGDSYY